MQLVDGPCASPAQFLRHDAGEPIRIPIPRQLGTALYVPDREVDGVLLYRWSSE